MGVNMSSTYVAGALYFRGQINLFRSLLRGCGCCGQQDAHQGSFWANKKILFKCNADFSAAVVPLRF